MQQALPKSVELVRMALSGPTYTLPAGQDGLGANRPKGCPQLAKGLTTASSQLLLGLLSAFVSDTVAVLVPSVVALAGITNDLQCERIHVRQQNERLHRYIIAAWKLAERGVIIGPA